MPRIIKPSQTTVTTKAVKDETKVNDLFLNLGFKMKDGSFARLSGSIVISVDTLLTEEKNIRDNTSEWASQQRVRNACIKELKAMFESLAEGETAMLDEFEGAPFTNKLTFQLSKRGAKAEVSDEAVADANEVDDLLA